MSPNNEIEILRPLAVNEIKELMSLYKEKYGIDDFHYLLFYNQWKWNKNLKELGIEDSDEKWNGFRKKFYTHRDTDFRKYGTYISLHFDLIQSVSFNSWEPELTELYECLENTNLIDWQRGPLLTNVQMEYCERVKEIAASKGVGVQRARQCCGFIMSHEVALNQTVPNLPSGYNLSELQLDNADLVHDTWANKKEGSLDYIRGLIQINKSLGIYRENDNKLVAWIIQNDFSGLGFLLTLPEIRRQGFGQILAAELCKRIAQSEDVVLSAWTTFENTNSRALMTKVGFIKSVEQEWIQLKPNL